VVDFGKATFKVRNEIEMKQDDLALVLISGFGKTYESLTRPKDKRFSTNVQTKTEMISEL
jgi:hypothetical protein